MIREYVPPPRSTYTTGREYNNTQLRDALLEENTRIRSCEAPRNEVASGEAVKERMAREVTERRRQGGKEEEVGGGMEVSARDRGIYAT